MMRDDASTFLPPQKCEKPYSISDINRGIAALIEKGNTLVWVEGEISNCKCASSGHCYLTLKDENSQIPAVIWRSTLVMLPFEPQTGQSVVVIASIRTYQKGGYYQLEIHKMQSSKVGELYAAFEEMKKRLQQEGLFDPAHKKPLPETVRRLGVITSKNGAAIRDIIKVVQARSPQVDILLVDVPVQGAAAPRAIARAIADMNAYGGVDCMIVGRGGGSMEDLAVFNVEIVARAIYASTIPVISAIGHEVDFTIADFVADVRAPTPSAAAEMAVPDTRESRRYFDNLSQRFSLLFRRFWHQAQENFQRIVSRPAWRKPFRILDELRQTQDDLHGRILSRMGMMQRQRALRLSAAAARLNALSPLNVLSRGYSVVTTGSGTAVRNANQLTEGDDIRLQFHHGAGEAKVTRVKPDPAANTGAQ